MAARHGLQVTARAPRVMIDKTSDTERSIIEIFCCCPGQKIWEMRIGASTESEGEGGGGRGINHERDEPQP